MCQQTTFTRRDRGRTQNMVGRYLAELEEGNWREEKGVDGLCFDSAVLIVCDQAAWLRLTNKRAAFHGIEKSSYIIDIAAWHYTPRNPGRLGALRIGLKGKVYDQDLLEDQEVG